uniref:TEA domain-containing protein n=1 Tax=Acrobeloides nanus TaxID=290746 RepID=A0A914CLE1_9BILA
MPRLPTIKEVKEKEDDIWSTEVEEAFQEALTMFPTKRRIRLSDGKCYGRNYLISQHIRKKCGKLRTAYQIASHLQVLDGKRKTQLEKLRDHLETNYLISPCSYSNTLLGLTDFGAIKFLHVRENQNSENYFTDAM